MQDGQVTTDSAETLQRLPPLGGQRLGPGSEQDDVHGTGDVPDSHLGVFHDVVRRGSMNPHRLPTGAKALSDSADGFAKERMVKDRKSTRLNSSHVKIS